MDFCLISLTEAHFRFDSVLFIRLRLAKNRLDVSQVSESCKRFILSIRSTNFNFRTQTCRAITEPIGIPNNANETRQLITKCTYIYNMYL